ncbi:hypothetical protein KUCAC02_002783 [Chaenocephalus aceratus]|uniref:Uncharacterized protein n=1 Tax=Chaenocephalus aceratus TaxID=36190 RepID=A0ACB9WIP2_CHAAC|nr:hypothetical protein KUCAC02_002783 [Chaenocephalus aceratus]
MDLRSGSKQQHSADKQILTSIEKIAPETCEQEVCVMAAEAQQHLSGGDSLILQEIRNGNQALSSKLDSKTAEINQSISGLKSMLDKLSFRVTEAEDDIGTAEDQLVDLDSRVVKLRKENDFLMEKVDQLENHS